MKRISLLEYDCMNGWQNATVKQKYQTSWGKYRGGDYTCDTSQYRWHRMDAFFQPDHSFIRRVEFYNDGDLVFTLIIHTGRINSTWWEEWIMKEDNPYPWMSTEQRIQEVANNRWEREQWETVISDSINDALAAYERGEEYDDFIIIKKKKVVQIENSDGIYNTNKQSL